MTTAIRPPAGRRRTGATVRRPASPPARRDHPSVTILGIDVAVLTGEQALARIDRMVDDRAAGAVTFANAHLVNLTVDHPQLRTAVRAVELVTQFDGGSEVQGVEAA